jgi:hypothetical protein
MEGNNRRVNLIKFCCMHVGSTTMKSLCITNLCKSKGENHLDLNFHPKLSYDFLVKRISHKVKIHLQREGQVGMVAHL